MAKNGKDKPNGKQGRNKEGTGNGGSIPPPKHRWKPGESGNPNGRPPKLSIARLLREQLAENDEARAKEVVKAIIDAAADGHPVHSKEILDRIDGKVADRLAGHDGGPLFKAYDGIEMDRV